MKPLKDDLKQKNFKPAYLLYGEEDFLIAYYAQALGDALIPDVDCKLMNCDNFDGKEIPAERIIDAANTLPFLNNKRVVYVKHSQLFTAGRKNESEAMAIYLSQIPESTVLIFVEKDTDKRSRLYKQIAAIGRTVECASPTQNELLKWVQKLLKKKGKTISTEAATHLLRTVSHSMATVNAEAQKLAAHAGERPEITTSDIDAVCSPGLESRIFDLIGALSSGQSPKALRLYRNMLLMKESPLMVLTMMARQFRLILQCKSGQDAKMHASEIARVFDLRGYIVDECLCQGRQFTESTLIRALHDCLDMDIRIKTGLMNAELGVEVLIVKYANMTKKEEKKVVKRERGNYS